MILNMFLEPRKEQCERQGVVGCGWESSALLAPFLGLHLGSLRSAVTCVENQTLGTHIQSNCNVFHSMTSAKGNRAGKQSWWRVSGLFMKQF